MKASQKNALHRMGVVILCALLFGLPLIFTRGYIGISIAKAIFFVAFVGFIVLVWIIGCLMAGRRKPNPMLTRSPIDIPMLLVALTSVLAAAFSRFPDKVWIGADARIQGALVIVAYALMYLALSNVVREVKLRSATMWLLAVAFMGVSLMAALHAFELNPLGFVTNPHYYFISTIGNVNFFSAFVCLYFPVVVGGFCFAERGKEWVFWLVAVLLGGPAAVMTCSESFFLGMAAFIAVAPFFLFSDGRRLSRFCFALAGWLAVVAGFYHLHNLRPEPLYQVSQLMSMLVGTPWVIAIVAVLVALGCLFAKVSISPRVLRWSYGGILIAVAVALTAFIWYVNTHEDAPLRSMFVITDDWGSGRGFIYRSCIEVIKGFSLKEWLFGIGPETLRYVLPHLGNTYVDQAHSEYLQTLMCTGIFGLLAQLGTIAATVWTALRRRDTVSVVLLWGLVTYWVQAAVNIAQGFTTPQMYVFIAIIGAMYKHAGSATNQQKGR